MAIFRCTGHCRCVGSTCWALLCKCTPLCWAPHGWPQNKGNVEPWVWPVSNLTQKDSALVNRVLKCAQLVDLNMLRACTEDKFSAFARSFRLFNARLDDYISEKEVKSRFCFGRDSINYLGDLLGDDLARNTDRNNPLLPLVQVLVALHFLTSEVSWR